MVGVMCCMKFAGERKERGLTCVLLLEEIVNQLAKVNRVCWCGHVFREDEIIYLEGTVRF